MGPGTVVALALPSSPEMLIAILAVLKAGAAYLPLAPEYPPARLEFILQDSGASMVVTMSSVLEQ